MAKRINSAILLRKFYVFYSQLSTPVFVEHQKVSVTVTKIERIPVVKKKKKKKRQKIRRIDLDLRVVMGKALHYTALGCLPIREN